MNIDKIKQLTNLIEYTDRLKVTVTDDGELRFKDTYTKISTKALAKELAEELNAAIEPIVAKYEATLRKELALCAKS